MGTLEGEGREKGTEAMFEAIMTKNFPQINARHQTIDPRSLENTKQNKYQIKPKTNKKYLGVSYSNFRKSKIF